ncbi:hypothetical protein SKP52_15745 [Sphingopyxis fribergensis]|uniref:Uncharacterized protein n=1 Tax=Sphingopyxis fribergensis TaxID=1515612 RepID=A0A0A7PQ03_9SPHN|nr:hypothetical protein [Sphingopyxis fribergensis]AJA10027.1 hypothetical protein SKP52_15745 [Sphingopyxis fribergensis]
MTNLLKDFLAGRAAAPARQPITNDPPAVTRAEFATLVKVVEALVEDVEVATSPEKLTEAMNAAVKPLLANMQVNAGGARGHYRAPLALPADGEGRGARTLANGKRDRGFLAPRDDDDGLGNIMPERVNNAAKNIPHFHLAPKGE